MSVRAEMPGTTSSAVRQLDFEHLLNGQLLLASDGSVIADGAVALVTALRWQAPRKLEVLAGVREFPARVKCATLVWHTLHAALKDQRTPVSTE